MSTFLLDCMLTVAINQHWLIWLVFYASLQYISLLRQGPLLREKTGHSPGNPTTTHKDSGGPTKPRGLKKVTLLDTIYMWRAEIGADNHKIQGEKFHFNKAS